MNRIIFFIFLLSSIVFSQTRTVETDIVKVRNGFQISDDGGTTWYDRTQFLIQAGAAGGDVQKIGTPANNQIAVWTGDGTIEGDPDFLWNGSVLEISPGTSSFYIEQPAGDVYGYRMRAFGPTTGWFYIPSLPGAYYEYYNNGSTAVDFNNLRLTEVGTPTAGTDAVTMNFLTIGSGYNLPIAAFNSGTGASASTYWRGDGTWATVAAAGGDVVKVGTPANNQIAVWTGDGTIEGDANFTWDGTAHVFNINHATNSNDFQINQLANYVFRIDITNGPGNSYFQFPGAPGTNYEFGDVSGNVDFNTMRLTDVGNPSAAQDAVTLTYLQSGYQPLEATLTDIADGTIGEDLINTSFPWADNEIANDITLSNITQITTRPVTSLTGTNWQVFYTNGSGVVTALGLGSAGQILTSNGTAAAPSWNTAGGGGDVVKVGTPVNNQIAVWTGDGTLEGEADITYDGADLTINGDLIVDDITGTGVFTMVQITIGAANIDEAELEILDGATLNTVELNYVDGVTSPIQTQLNAKQGTLTNEAGLYAALSDVDQFYEVGDPIPGDDIVDESIDATELAANSVDSEELVDGSIDESHLNVTNTPVDDYILSYNASGGNFTWVASGAGSGNVSNTGTPVNNQLAIWTDATTIEGDADLTFDGTNMTVSGTVTAGGFTIGAAIISETELEILDGATLTTTELNYVDGVTSAIQTQLGTKSTISGTPVNNQLAVWTGATAVEGDANLTWSGVVLGVTGNVTVSDDPYAAYWDGSTQVPTKNAIFDKIEGVVAGAVDSSFVTVTADTGRFDYLAGKTGNTIALIDTLTGIGTLIGLDSISSRNAEFDTVEVADKFYVGISLFENNYSGFGYDMLTMGDATNLGRIRLSNGAGYYMTMTLPTITSSYNFRFPAPATISGALMYNASGSGTANMDYANALTYNGAGLLRLGSSTQDGGLLFWDDDAGGDANIQIYAPDGLGTDYVLTLPANDGDASQVLTTNGSGVLSWTTPGGGGNVSKVGTPVDNQIGVWTGDGTIEGNTNFKWTYSTTSKLDIGSATNGAWVQIAGNSLDPFVINNYQAGSNHWMFMDNYDLASYTFGWNSSGSYTFIESDIDGTGGSSIQFIIDGAGGSGEDINLIPGGDDVNIGTASSTDPQKLNVFDGGADNEPGALVLYTDAGVPYYFFVRTDGTFAKHTSFPTDDDTDGSTVGGGGGGDVSKVGTPANNQIGVWTGDGTIEGDPDFTFDGAGGLTIGSTGNDGSLVIYDDDVGGDATVTVQAPDALGTSYTLTLPANDGDASQFLQTNGTGTLTWATPGGGGNVSNTGTPADNQIAVWTNATTVEGTSGLTYNGTAFNVTGNITLSGTVDGIDIATDVAANTAKVSNATHTGDVTGSTTLTIAANAVEYTETSGSIKSLTPVADDADNFASNFTGANLYGGTFVANATGTIVLPAVGAGMNFTVITLGAIQVVIDPNASDLMITDGVAGADGANITNLSTAGDIAVVQYYDATGWLVTTNGWTPE